MGRREQIGWMPEHALDQFDEGENIGWDMLGLHEVKAGDRYSLNGGPDDAYGYLPVGGDRG